MTQNQNSQTIPSNWPFPVSNGVRSAKSESLLENTDFSSESIDVNNNEEEES
jgi:hypothetical protein